MLAATGPLHAGETQLERAVYAAAEAGVAVQALRGGVAVQEAVAGVAEELERLGLMPTEATQRVHPHGSKPTFASACTLGGIAEAGETLSAPYGTKVFSFSVDAAGNIENNYRPDTETGTARSRSLRHLTMTPSRDRPVVHATAAGHRRQNSDFGEQSADGGPSPARPPVVSPI